MLIDVFRDLREHAGVSEQSQHKVVKYLASASAEAPNLGDNIGTAQWWSHFAALCGLMIAVILLGTLPGLQASAAKPQTVVPLYLASAQIAGTAISAWDTDPIAEQLAQDRIDLFLTPPPKPVEQRRDVKVKSGDTLMQVLTRADIARGEAHAAIVAIGKLYDVRKLRAGQHITLIYKGFEGADLAFHGLAIPDGFARYSLAARNEAGFFEASAEELDTLTNTYRAEGRIDNSLFLAAERAGVPVPAIVELIRIYSFDVDFQRDIRKGDRFELLFEEVSTEDGSSRQTGNVLYASLTLRGQKNELFRYTPEDDGRTDYFTRAGESVRKALMKTPIDGARLTSSFGMRKHPVLGYSKMHKGSDFGARTGTPIMAAGDGVVERANWHGGYGKYVRIRHNSSYKTAYAHMHGFAKGVHAGARVKQGQIIGYVGSTGRSTGPHLHYEVIKDGKHINPMRMKLPTGRKLKDETLTHFLASVEQMDVQIAEAPLTRKLAQAD